jgi:hypothetical protein
VDLQILFPAPFELIGDPEIVDRESGFDESCATDRSIWFKHQCAIYAHRDVHQIGRIGLIPEYLADAETCDFSQLGEVAQPNLSRFVDPVEGSAPKGFVDCDTGRLWEEVRPRPKQQLVRNDPNIGPLPALPLIAACCKELAFMIAVLAGMGPDVAQRALDQFCPFEVLAHFRAGLLGVIRLPPAVNSPDYTICGKVANDLVAEPVSRHGEDAGKVFLN